MYLFNIFYFKTFTMCNLDVISLAQETSKHNCISELELALEILFVLPSFPSDLKSLSNFSFSKINCFETTLWNSLIEKAA